MDPNLTGRLDHAIMARAYLCSSPNIKSLLRLGSLSVYLLIIIMRVVVSPYGLGFPPLLQQSAISCPFRLCVGSRSASDLSASPCIDSSWTGDTCSGVY